MKPVEGEPRHDDDPSFDVDLEDYLDEVDTDDLVEELETRGKKIAGGDQIVSVNRDLANRLRDAYYRRDASRFEALLVAFLDPQEVKKAATTPGLHV